MINLNNNETVFFQVEKRGRKKTVYYAYNEGDGFRPVDTSSSNKSPFFKIMSHLDMTQEQLFDEFGIEDLKKLTKTKLIRVFTNESGLKITDTGYSSQDVTTTIGQGIETNVYPQYIVFGKVLLMLEKLHSTHWKDSIYPMMRFFSASLMQIFILMI